MKELVSELVPYLKTKDAMSYFINRIDTAVLELSSSDVSHLDNYFTIKEMSTLVKYITSFDDLKALREELMQIPVITVKIAFRASAYFESVLTDSILRFVKEACVVQILFDRHLLGGAVVDFKGKYRDFSMAGAINEWRRRRM